MNQPRRDKPETRAHFEKTIAALGPSRRAAAAQSLVQPLVPSLSQTLSQTRSTTTPTHIFAYAAFGDELSLDPFIEHALEHGAQICIPKIDWETKTMSAAQIQNLDSDLTAGRYGIRTPRPGCPDIDPERVGAALIPGLAFTAQGIRLGRGAGFYDRWIAQRSTNPTPCRFIGVCYDEQLAEHLPTEPHDMRVDLVVTPNRVHRRSHG